MNITSTLERFDEKAMTDWDIPTVEQSQVKDFIRTKLTALLESLKMEPEDIIEMEIDEVPLNKRLIAIGYNQAVSEINQRISEALK